jgi:hypothetical protein
MNDLQGFRLMWSHFSKMTWDLHDATVDLHGVLNVRECQNFDGVCVMLNGCLVPTKH